MAREGDSTAVDGGGGGGGIRFRYVGADQQEAPVSCLRKLPPCPSLPLCPCLCLFLCLPRTPKGCTSILCSPSPPPPPSVSLCLPSAVPSPSFCPAGGKARGSARGSRPGTGGRGVAGLPIGREACVWGESRAQRRSTPASAHTTSSHPCRSKTTRCSAPVDVARRHHRLLWGDRARHHPGAVPANGLLTKRGVRTESGASQHSARGSSRRAHLSCRAAHAVLSRSFVVVAQPVVDPNDESMEQLKNYATRFVPRQNVE